MDKRYINYEVSPGADFFRMCTEHWIDYHEKPAEYARWCAFGVLDEEVTGQLKSLLSDKLLHRSDKMSMEMQKFYALMCNYDERNRLGASPIKKYIDEIKNAGSKEDLFDIAMKHKMVCLCNVGLGIDDKSSDDYVVSLSQSLSFGNKDYYKEDDKSHKIEIWKRVFSEAVVMSGLCSEDEIRDMMDVFFDYEKQIAEVAYSNEELEVPEDNYHKMSVVELSERVGFDMQNLLKGLLFDKTEDVIVRQVDAVVLGLRMMNEMSIEDAKKIMTYEIIKSLIGKTTEEIKEKLFEYEKEVYGKQERSPLWKRELAKMESLFSDEFSKLYITEYFSERKKIAVIEMVENLRSSFKEIIEEQLWMSDKTKNVALNKLMKMKYKIAYPDKWLDFSDLEVNDELCYIDCCVALGDYFYKKEIERCYGKKVDKQLWYMSPQTVNAYYNPSENEIVFPAAILQCPFYGEEQSVGENYGSIGVVIAHEMTHGFDAMGRVFDCDGNMNDWWEDDDENQFEDMTVDIIEHYDEIEVFNDLHCNGLLTLNENIADCGGIRIALRALKKLTDDEEEIRKFFISYAQTWACVITDEMKRETVKNNVHSLNEVRVNGTLPMIKEWYEVFGIGDNDKLYLKEEKRSKLW